MTCRIRYLKPDFFVDEDVSKLPPLVRLFYQGLWTHADREGRLEDRSQRLKVEIMPYEEGFDAEVALAILARPKRPGGPPFILRYEVRGERYIKILSWKRHQKPHHTERASEIPAPPPDNGPLTVKRPLSNGSLTGRNGDWNGNGDRDGDGNGEGVRGGGEPRPEENAPPAPSRGSGSASPEGLAEPSRSINPHLISESTIQEMLKIRGKSEVLALLREGGYPIPEFLLENSENRCRVLVEQSSKLNEQKKSLDKKISSATIMEGD